jgi:chemotaxis protein MotB
MRSPLRLIALLSAVTCVACVTRSKHESTVKTWKGKLDEANDKYAKLEKQRAADIARLEGEKTDLEKKKNAEIAALNKSKAELKKHLEQELAGIAKSLSASKKEIAELRAHRRKIEKSLAQFRKLQEAFRAMIGAGEIRVYRRRGRIMVALPSSVLFASGKAKLSKAGLKAVEKVSKVFAKLPDRRFLVAGHTDNVPIHTRKFKDNWALSTARAEMVTRFLISNGVSPKSIAAAGYSEYDPLVPNSTTKNKAINRRIEIILMPNVDELPGIPDTPQR